MAFKSILFLCVANSARSQIAEAIAREIFGEGVTIQSAGSNPSRVNPFAVTAMAEVDISLDRQRSKSVATIDPSGIDLVVTLCKEEVCPAFLGTAKKLHWPIEDPDRAKDTLSDAQRLDLFRKTREEIRGRLQDLARRSKQS